MRKNKLLGITFFVLMLLCIMISHDRNAAPPIIDIIFVKIGLKPWTNPEYNLGTHYSAFFTLIILIISYNRTKYYLKDIYPKLTKNLLLVLFGFLFFIYPITYNSLDKFIKIHSTGLNCIEYKQKSSVCHTSVYNKKFLKLDADIILKNYGKEDVYLYIKLIPDIFLAKDTGSKKPITAINLETNKPQNFTLYANSSTSLQATFIVPNKENLSETNGTMKGFDIIIFDKNKKKVFSTRYIK